MTRWIWILIPILISIFVGGSVHAQGIIVGRVLEIHSRQPVPGVTIMVAGSSLGASSATDGKFSIQIPRDTCKLMVQCVGYEPQSINARVDDSTRIFVKVQCNIDFFHRRSVELSIYTGVINTPLGGNMKLLFPYVFKAKNMLPAPRIEVGYQMGGRDYQQRATIALDELFVNCDFDISLLSNFQKIHLAQEPLDFERYTLGVKRLPINGSFRLPIYLGAGLMNYRTESVLNKKIGFELGTQKLIFRHQYILLAGKIAWWQSFWQYQASIEKDATRYSLAAEFNIIKGYQEVNLRIGYKFSY